MPTKLVGETKVLRNIPTCLLSNVLPETLNSSIDFWCQSRSMEISASKQFPAERNVSSLVICSNRKKIFTAVTTKAIEIIEALCSR